MTAPGAHRRLAWRAKLGPVLLVLPPLVFLFVFFLLPLVRLLGLSVEGGIKRLRSPEFAATGWSAPVGGGSTEAFAQRLEQGPSSAFLVLHPDGAVRVWRVG